MTDRPTLGPKPPRAPGAALRNRSDHRARSGPIHKKPAAQRGTSPPRQPAGDPAEALPPGFPARRAALRMLDAVMRRGDALDQAAEPATRDVPRAEDKALAIAIAAEVLRWSVDLDLMIDSATRLQLAPDAKARMVLRLALIQPLKMGTPPHAAIATALPLTEGGPRKLVHGVFGTLLRSDARLPDVPSLPVDVAARWTENWGAEAVSAAGHALAIAPPLDLILKDPSETALWAERLGGVSLAPGHVRLARGHAVQNLAGYGDGAWWVQDISASIPARLLGTANAGADIGAGKRALDVGAAPGGKTMQLAAAGWDVTAIDQSAKRMDRVTENLARVQLAADRIVANALNWEPEAPFDAILIDAPCSATGIFRRHPDVLHRVTRDMIAVQSGIQANMLARASAWANPAAVMVYATCSLEPEEGEAQIDAFLAHHADWMRDPVMHSELPSGFAPSPDGYVRILPGTLAEAGGADGFFIARLKRRIP